MDMHQHPAGIDWLAAMKVGELGVWDLRLDLETVQYSPQWKQRLGFPEPHESDSTHFWRCRVHPADLQDMMAAIREHAQGRRPDYEARFRLRSNGSGYRSVMSRGRVIERSAEGRALRMVGTMLDLTERPPTPLGGLPEGPRGEMAGAPLALPLHVLLGAESADMDAPMRATLEGERQRVLAQMEDLLLATVAQLNDMRSARPSAA